MHFSAYTAFEGYEPDLFGSVSASSTFTGQVRMHNKHPLHNSLSISIFPFFAIKGPLLLNWLYIDYTDRDNFFPGGYFFLSVLIFLSIIVMYVVFAGLSMINISIAGRDEHDRKAVTDLLAGHDDFRIASVGQDGYDAIRSAKKHRPDIIITDFNMTDIDSADLAPIIKRHSPSTKLITLCSRIEDGASEDGVLGKALRAGISGCLLKQADFDNLASSVRSVFHGGLYVSDRVKHHVPLFLKELPLLKNNNRRHCFSPTELQIFYRIALGYDDKEIASQLNINEGTLRNSVYRVKRKTGLQNRTHITVYALLSGMINPNKIWDSFRTILENF
jgi:DNA-binding NarL/FixJ family response regulator